jgi:hypothetical protein
MESIVDIEKWDVKILKVDCSTAHLLYIRSLPNLVCQIFAEIIEGYDGTRDGHDMSMMTMIC